MSYTSSFRLTGKVESVDADANDLIINTLINGTSASVKVHALRHANAPLDIISEGDMISVQGHMGNNGRAMGVTILPAWNNSIQVNYVEAEGVVAQLSFDKFALLTFTPKNKAVKVDCCLTDRCTDMVIAGSIVNIKGYINDGKIMAEQILTYNNLYDAEQTSASAEED